MVSPGRFRTTRPDASSCVLNKQPSSKYGTGRDKRSPRGGETGPVSIRQEKNAVEEKVGLETTEMPPFCQQLCVMT